MITDTLESTKEFVDDLNNINLNPGNIEVGTLNFNSYNALLESVNIAAQNESVKLDQVPDKVRQLVNADSTKEPDYNKKLELCHAQKNSPGPPTPAFAPYDNFFAYRIYESFSVYGILCSFSRIDLLNFVKWPISCAQTCGYKHLNVKAKLTTEKGIEGLIKYAETLKKLSKKDRDQCICYSYYTIVSLGTDLSYLLFYVILTLFPLLALFGCCFMISYPVAVYKQIKKKKFELLLNRRRDF